jgi:hypothetical protein
MTLKYKLEFNWDDEDPSDPGVYIQLKGVNPPIYRPHTDKEDYDVLPAEEKHDFLTGIFNIQGVVELSSKAYRVWLMKSPQYDWEEVLDPVLAFLLTEFGETELEELPGSGKPDGTGFTLSSPRNRRDR